MPPHRLVEGSSSQARPRARPALPGHIDHLPCRRGRVWKCKVAVQCRLCMSHGPYQGEYLGLDCSGPRSPLAEASPLQTLWILWTLLSLQFHSAPFPGGSETCRTLPLPTLPFADIHALPCGRHPVSQPHTKIEGKHQQPYVIKVVTFFFFFGGMPLPILKRMKTTMRTIDTHAHTHTQHRCCKVGRSVTIPPQAPVGGGQWPNRLKREKAFRGLGSLP